MRSYNDKEIAELEKKANSAYRLRSVLRSLFDAADNFIVVTRVILYAGSCAGAYWYLNDLKLAIVIAISLGSAHLLVFLREYIEAKKKEISEDL